MYTLPYCHTYPRASQKFFSYFIIKFTERWNVLWRVFSSACIRCNENLSRSAT